MIQRAHSVGFTVADLEQAKRFYIQVLPFELIGEAEVMGEAYERLTGVFGARLRVARLRLGEEEIQLTQYVAPPGGRRIPQDSRSNDLWFQHIAIVVSDIDAAYARLREHNVQHVSTALQTLPDYLGAAAGIKAFYFRDPDGHNLELIWFPEGKGDPRWWTRPALFLGIDHTAIAVSSTPRSLEIYRDALGLKIAGTSHNYGAEQEHLNMVFGAHLQITGLRASARGIGMEFLDYLAPASGRATPSDTHANDLWHWETTLVSDDIQREFETLNAAAGKLVSSPVVELPHGDVYGYRRAFLLRDFDGHALKIVEV